MSGTRDTMFSGMIWTFLRQSSLQIFSIAEGIILARILSPKDYGLVAMPAIFMAISGCFIDSGFATALVRDKTRKAIDYSTVFVTTVFMTAFFSLLLCLCSGYIADFYNEPILKTIVCANAVLLFLNSFLSIQNTRLTIKLDFKAQNIIRTVTNIVIGIVVIICALCGMGIWSLVWPNFIMPFLNGYLYYRHDRWFPGFKFSWRVWRKYFSFGSKLLISNLVSVIYDNLYPMVIGKKFPAADLGYFTKASSYAELPSYTIRTIVGPVAYPVMSAIEKEEELRTSYLRLVALSCYLVFPLVFGMAILAKPFIMVLITEKWAPAIVFLQLLCFARMWGPFVVLSKDFLQVKGRSDLFMKIELITKALSILALVICIPIGIKAMCVGLVITSVFSMLVNLMYVNKVGGFSVKTQLKNIAPSIIYSSSMGLIIYLVILQLQSYAAQLIVGIVIGIIYYIFISKVTKSRDYKSVMSIVKEKIVKRFVKKSWS
ncbi:lipopolysaccharide biosynthesis protein [uncultured Bacteroides sp.]|uniref:lipopolysaccharide biosynthesis protein n=1 Tax=uncultured Bacteroides sp. TaxID=162156 RepID=UPI0025B07817|nr:lipopolysaccharide biosynthesis protein [uncultured Bacteroides sp.]